MSTSEQVSPPGWSAERLARAAWSRLAEPTDKVAGDLVAEFGAQGALDRVARDPSVGGGRFAPRWAAWCPAAEEERAHRLGIRVVVPGDPEWPEGAERLERPPVCLWVRGPANLQEVLGSSVAVVGARSATAYGTSVSRSAFPAGYRRSTPPARKATVVPAAASAPRCAAASMP